MIFRILGGVVVVALLVALIDAYLSPDDLARCQPMPVQEAEDSNCRPADVIVAVSGGDTVARTSEAVKLYNQGWAPRLLFSGAAADKSGPSNASAMREYALAEGVPNSAILTEEFSETTRQNAQLSNSVFVNNEYARAILVTSGYHQRRAGIEFRNSVASSVEVIDHPVSRDGQWSEGWWMTVTGWRLALSELIKIILVYIGVPR